MRLVPWRGYEQFAGVRIGSGRGVGAARKVGYYVTLNRFPSLEGPPALGHGSGGDQEALPPIQETQMRVLSPNAVPNPRLRER